MVAHGQRQSASVKAGVRGLGSGVGPGIEGLQAISSEDEGEEGEVTDNGDDDDDDVRIFHFTFIPVQNM